MHELSGIANLADCGDGEEQMLRIVEQFLKSPIEMQVPVSSLIVESIEYKSVDPDLSRSNLHLAYCPQKA